MKVLVVGDTILDLYCYGKTPRVSPENPNVSVFEQTHNEIKLGGACNVLNNIHKLNQRINLDYCGWLDAQTLQQLNNQIYNKHWNNNVAPEHTIVKKTRYVANNKQLLRIDSGIGYHDLKLSILKSDLLELDLIVISDYDKGTIIPEVFNFIYKNSTCQILIDLKKHNNIECLQSDRIILKMNESEWKENGANINNLSTVITLGRDGWMTNQSKKKNKSNETVSSPDVIGAGDSFLAGMAVYYLETKDWNIDAMAEFGNTIAQQKVKRFGTYAVNRRDLGKLDETKPEEERE